MHTAAYSHIMFGKCQQTIRNKVHIITEHYKSHDLGPTVPTVPFHIQIFKKSCACCWVYNGNVQIMWLELSHYYFLIHQLRLSYLFFSIQLDQKIWCKANISCLTSTFNIHDMGIALEKYTNMYFWSKVNICNVNSVWATALIFDSWMDVLVKVF